MRVLMLSKALVTGAYQRKCELIAAHPDVQLTVLVPSAWRTGNQLTRLERIHVQNYTLSEIPIRFNGNFHLHHYPTLEREIQALRPDVVHIDEEPYNFATWLALRSARSVRAKSLFFTWQNLNRTYPPPFSLFERYAFTHSDYAIAGNRDAVNVLRAKGYHGAVSVIPQFGVDPEVYRPGAPRDHAVFRVGYVGRLVHEKGIDMLLRAVAVLPEVVHLDIIGTGEEQNALQQLATQLNLFERVRFLGALPSMEVPARMAAFDVLVLPSITQSNWKEQFGRVLIEAMACGVPVIGSTCGEIPNVIGDAGMIFTERFEDELRESIEFLLLEPDRRTRYAALGRARVLEHYTMQRIADETVAVYRNMLQLA
jgi:glycosyltransferase involved in cell wall biosynthesis